MKIQRILKVLLVFISVILSSCHDEPKIIYSGPEQLVVGKIMTLNVEDYKYELSITGLAGGWSNEDKNFPAVISLYPLDSEIAIRSVSVNAVDHRTNASGPKRPYSGLGNIVAFHDYIVYSDQWPLLLYPDEKNILSVYDKELNEIRTVETQQGVIRESNGRLLIINHNLEYTIMDREFKVIASGRIENNRNEISKCFSYRCGCALPVYYYDGTSDIVTIVMSRTDSIENIGYVLNLTNDTATPIYWNLDKFGHWYPSHLILDVYEVETQGPGSYEWKDGIRPYYDSSREKFVYPCIAYGTDGGQQLIIDNYKPGIDSFALIGLDGSVTLQE